MYILEQLHESVTRSLSECMLETDSVYWTLSVTVWHTRKWVYLCVGVSEYVVVYIYTYAHACIPCECVCACVCECVYACVLYVCVFPCEYLVNQEAHREHCVQKAGQHSAVYTEQKGACPGPCFCLCLGAQDTGHRHNRTVLDCSQRVTRLWGHTGRRFSPALPGNQRRCTAGDVSDQTSACDEAPVGTREI